MALKLPTRRSAPQLTSGRSSGEMVPAFRGRLGSAAQRVYGSGQRGAQIVGAGARRAGSSVARAGAKGREYLEGKGREETLGGIFARNVAPGVAAVLSGAVDQTEPGKKFFAWTKGVVKLSSALAIAGGTARGFGWDRRYLGKHITRGNTALLTAKIPIALYNLGERIPGALTGAMGKASTGAQTAVAGAPARREIEVVPGEATVS